MRVSGQADKVFRFSIGRSRPDWFRYVVIYKPQLRRGYHWNSLDSSGMLDKNTVTDNLAVIEVITGTAWIPVECWIKTQLLIASFSFGYWRDVVIPSLNQCFQ